MLDDEIDDQVRAMVAMDTLERIENRIEELHALLERYRPLLDMAEQRLTGKPRRFGGNRAQSQS